MMDKEKAKNILISILHTDGAYMDYLESEEVEAIKFLASDERPHGEWIPCSERLPEEIGDYLVTDYRGNVYCSSFDYILGEKCFNYEDDGYPVEDDTIVAWMPLPEPYRKEGEEK